MQLFQIAAIVPETKTDRAALVLEPEWLMADTIETAKRIAIKKLDGSVDLQTVVILARPFC